MHKFRATHCSPITTAVEAVEVAHMRCTFHCPSQYLDAVHSPIQCSVLVDRCLLCAALASAVTAGDAYDAQAQAIVDAFSAEQLLGQMTQLTLSTVMMVHTNVERDRGYRGQQVADHHGTISDRQPIKNTIHCVFESIYGAAQQTLEITDKVVGFTRKCSTAQDNPLIANHSLNPNTIESPPITVRVNQLEFETKKGGRISRQRRRECEEELRFAQVDSREREDLRGLGWRHMPRKLPWKEVVVGVGVSDGNEFLETLKAHKVSRSQPTTCGICTNPLLHSMQYMLLTCVSKSAANTLRLLSVLAGKC
ncbi:hypothetical protein GQ600_10840 [Phytophthora cactorum]|nr:hypothetical protein GQ600_10840 [Phytophthora cactorum]